MHIISVKGQNILLLSDTHGKHRLLGIPDNVQIVIHCGDICNDGNTNEILDFFDWYASLNIPHKIFTHGNHDLPFELEPEKCKKLVPHNVIWLIDQTIKICGIKLKALSPFFHFHHTNYNEKEDILISHYPPKGILDNGFGIEELRNYVINSKPKFHVFGHNHNNFGILNYKNIHFINASVFNMILRDTKK